MGSHAASWSSGGKAEASAEPPGSGFCLTTDKGEHQRTSAVPGICILHGHSANTERHLSTARGPGGGLAPCMDISRDRLFRCRSSRCEPGASGFPSPSLLVPPLTAVAGMPLCGRRRAPQRPQVSTSEPARCRVFAKSLDIAQIRKGT